MYISHSVIGFFFISWFLFEFIKNWREDAYMNREDDPADKWH